jgi:hypothetical protein
MSPNELSSGMTTDSAERVASNEGQKGKLDHNVIYCRGQHIG